MMVLFRLPPPPPQPPKNNKPTSRILFLKNPQWHLEELSLFFPNVFIFCDDSDLDRSVSDKHLRFPTEVTYKTDSALT